MLKTLGILSWAGCLLTLTYQGIHWVLFKSWPTLDILSVLQTLFGLDLLTIVRTLPLDVAAKGLYVCFTTELTLFLWWLGVFFFGLMLILQLASRK